MPGLTVSEKSHWRDRLAARIQKAVERIRARHPALFDRISREAHARALTSLGLADSYADLEAIKAEEGGLAQRPQRLGVRLAANPVEQGRVGGLDPRDGPVDPGGDPVAPVGLLGDRQAGHDAPPGGGGWGRVW